MRMLTTEEVSVRVISSCYRSALQWQLSLIVSAILHHFTGELGNWGRRPCAYRRDGNSLSPPTWARSSLQICPVIREVLFIDESTAIDRMVSTQVCLCALCVLCVLCSECIALEDNLCTVPSFMARHLFCSSVCGSWNNSSTLTFYAFLLCRWQQCGAECVCG